MTVCIGIASAAMCIADAEATPVKVAHVEVALMSRDLSVRPGTTAVVGLHMRMDKNWHTYWRNAGGDIGFPTTLNWTLPEGFKAGPIRWPYPEKFLDTLIEGEPPMASYGYKDDVVLLVDIATPPAIQTETVTFAVDASWLACEMMCIPGSATLSITLPVSDEPPQDDPEWVTAFATAEARVPAAPANWIIRVSPSEDKLVFTIRHAAGTDMSGITDVQFFPYQAGIINDAADQQLETAADAATLTVPLASAIATAPERIQGVLVASPSWPGTPSRRALEIDHAVGVQEQEAIPPRTASATDTAPAVPVTFWSACLLAFVGGMILNLMPCVLPVLSLKVLSFVKKADQDRRGVWKHGVVFTLGVLVTFWSLSGVLVAIRLAGHAVGWGFQLQSPVFLFALIALLFLFGLSLLGVFEIGTSFIGLGADASNRAGYGGTFYTGILAVLVATPCTAPFMGTAMGFALTQPWWASTIIFTCLGLGLATPYVLLTFMPGLLRFLPKPGAWMESFKQLMGFFLLATVVWLLWVLGNQVNNDRLARVLAALLCMGIAGWVLGRWSVPVKPTRVRVGAKIACLSLLVLGTGFGLQGIDNATAVKADVQEHSAWIPYSESRLHELRAAGEPVFIDFTADWCLTCKVNERVAFTPEVVKQFQDRGITLMVADFTSHDEAISAALSRYGRSGVPLYVLYGPGADTSPSILPQLLTPGIVLDAIDGM